MNPPIINANNCNNNTNNINLNPNVQFYLYLAEIGEDIKYDKKIK